MNLLKKKAQLRQVGASWLSWLDTDCKSALAGIQEIIELEESKRTVLLDLIDTYIRDFKTRQAYASW